MRLAVRSRLALIGAGLLILTATRSASAQQVEPIGPFVVDLRGSLARFGQNALVAQELQVTPDRLPSNGLGVEIGGHVYVLRWRAITFGIGGSVHLSRARAGPPPVEPPSDPPDPDAMEPPPPTAIETRFVAFAPQISFNFGSGRGWSYVSGGIAPTRLSILPEGAPRPDRSSKTINYGGGARWFARPHLAFTFDVRFYAISPLAGEPGLPAQPRMTLLVFSAGVSIK